MAFVLSAGSFSAIQKDFCRSFVEGLENRRDPLRDQHLILVPSAALRKHLLQALFETGCRSFSAVRFVSFNGLAQEILMDSLREPYTALDDPTYFSLALQSAAITTGLRDFQAYRTARGLSSTFRDLVDGLLTPELLEQFLDYARSDPELQRQAGNMKSLRDLHRLYRTFLDDLNTQQVVNVQYSAALAIEHAANWIGNKNIQGLHVYGFYDSTPAQFEMIETLVRSVRDREGEVRIYFPFVVASNNVEHPAEYAQDFYESLRSLAAKMGSDAIICQEEPSGASHGIEHSLFAEAEGLPPTASIRMFNAGSPYEEAWAVAKKILQLVLNEGVRLDQIGVITRSLEPCRAVFQHVFNENNIPHSIPKDFALCTSTSGHFVYLLLLARQSDLNHNLVFELLCSPLMQSTFAPAGIIRELLEILFITNSRDWHRLKPVADPQKKLPEIFELAEDDPRVAIFRLGASYLVRLKEQIESIPLKGRFSDFTNALKSLIQEIAHPVRYQEAGGLELELLLDRIGDLPLESEFKLNEFTEIFKDYLSNTINRIESNVESQVAIGDIMGLRGVPFDYVFITGLNQDVWPLRGSEDPFLPDGLRSAIRSTTGAGPHPKRRSSGDEELLLFSLALRSARNRVHLSYQRADSEGRMKSASIYIEEILRLLPGTSVEQIPRHLEKRLTAEYLPAVHECSTLVRRFSASETLQEFYKLPADYFQNTLAFAEMLNTMDRTAAGPIDGVVNDAGELWKTLSDGKLRFSYSRIKAYVLCGFSFYSDRILKLQPSPFKPTEIPHDLTPLVKGRIAESVVKEAVLKLRAGIGPVDEAVISAESKIRRKYAPYLPKVLTDHYLLQFTKAARVLLEYLKSEGYDFAYAETPGRNYISEITLLVDPAGTLNIYGIPDLLFYGNKKLIGEMKWGAKSTSETADSMFGKGELQFCFYPELERQKRELLDSADFRYFRLNIFGELGSPTELEQKLKRLGAPAKLDTTLRIFGLAPTQQEIAENFAKLKEIGKGILQGEFKILEDPNDYWSPCTTCGFILICRRTHSATLLRAKKDGAVQEEDPS